MLNRLRIWKTQRPKASVLFFCSSAFATKANATATDFDPEDLSDRGHGSEDESDGGVDASAGRGHYEAVE